MVDAALDHYRRQRPGVGRWIVELGVCPGAPHHQNLAAREPRRRVRGAGLAHRLNGYPPRGVTLAAIDVVPASIVGLAARHLEPTTAWDTCRRRRIIGAAVPLIDR